MTVPTINHINTPHTTTQHNDPTNIQHNNNHDTLSATLNKLTVLNSNNKLAPLSNTPPKNNNNGNNVQHNDQQQQHAATDATATATTTTTDHTNQITINDNKHCNIINDKHDDNNNNTNNKKNNDNNKNKETLKDEIEELFDNNPDWISPDEAISAHDTYCDNLVVVKDNNGHSHHHIQIYNNNTGGVKDISLSPNNITQKQKVVITKDMIELVKEMSARPYLQQLAINTFVMATSAYAALVAGLLVIFTPQTCCTDYNGFKADYGQCNTNVQMTAYSCTTYDEFHDLSTFNKAVLGFNFMTLGAMIIYFFIVMNREKYIVKHLVEDPLLNEIHIRSQWSSYPEIQYYIHRKNRDVFIACAICVCIQVINMMLSSILIFVYYSSGKESIIRFLSNLLVQGGAVFKAADITYTDWKYHLARTVFADEPISYNKVNPKFATNQI